MQDGVSPSLRFGRYCDRSVGQLCEIENPMDRNTIQSHPTTAAPPFGAALGERFGLACPLGPVKWTTRRPGLVVLLLGHVPPISIPPRVEHRYASRGRGPRPFAFRSRRQQKGRDRGTAVGQFVLQISSLAKRVCDDGASTTLGRRSEPILDSQRERASDCYFAPLLDSQKI